MEIEQVVEEFLKLVAERKNEDAEKLILKESQSRENELAYWLCLIGVENGVGGNYLLALCCFQAAMRIVKSVTIKEEIIHDLIITHNNYGILLQNMKRFQEAENHYKTALEIDPDFLEAHYNYARLLYDMKRFQEAENHYKEALRINPEHAEVHNNYASLLYYTKRLQEAEVHYKEVLRINPERIVAHYNYANLLYDMKRFQEAENHYKEALEIDPGHVKTHNAYATLLYSMKRFQEAENRCKIALEINPKYAKTQCNYANLLYIMKKFQEAENHYRIALEIDFEDAETHYNYANLLHDTKRVQEAENHYKISLRINPEDARAHYNYAVLLYDTKRLQEAEVHYKEVLRIDTKHINAHCNYANMLYDMKRYQEAEVHYKESLRINPENAEAHYNYAVLLYDMKRYQEAEVHYKESLRINPKQVEAHNNYAVLLQNMKRFHEAEIHFKIALEIDPENAKTHYNYANLLYDMKRFQEAENHYRIALEIEPKLTEVHFSYADLLKTMKRFWEAENHCKEALEIDPKNAEAHNNYALLLRVLKRYQEAEGHYKESLRINPKLVEAHNNYAIMLHIIKRYQEAEIQYRIALEIGLKSPEIHYNYANLLYDMKRFHEAENHCKIALEIDPENAKAHYNYANLLFYMKRFQEAENHYKESLRIDPENAEAYQNLGIIYFEQKEFPDASNLFERASNIFKQKEMLFEHKKTEALKFFTIAKSLWREESWEYIRENLEMAINNFQACGIEDHARICNSILILIIIDEYFNKSLESKSLLNLRDSIKKVFNAIIKFKKDLEGSEIYEYKIFAAKFSCIELLFKALNHESYNFKNLERARRTLREEGFTKAVQSLNLLENFILNLSEFENVGLEKIPKKEEKRLLSSLKPMRYLDGYVTARALQEIQKPFESWKRPQTPIEYVDFNLCVKRWARVGIVQLQFTLVSDNDILKFPPTPRNSQLLKERFLNYLELAVKENLDIVCFPEYSMTPEILKIIKEKNIKDLIIIGGSYYKNGKNICPIIFNNKVRYIQKIHPSKYCEFSPVDGKGMDSGDRLYLFITPFGKFVVLICEDFRVELPNVLSQIDDLDFIIIISCNPNTERFHELANPIPSNYPMYILQSNISEMGDKFGKSCIFGIIEDDHAKELTQERLRPSDNYRNKVSEIQGEGMIIAEFNLIQKNIPTPTPVDFQTIRNVKHVKL